MTAMNAVRMKVKPGRDADFLNEHKGVGAHWQGLRRASIIKTGVHDYCIIAEWDDMDSLVANRPSMVANLDKFRDMLEDLGNGLGVTDPVSGPVVMQVK